MECSSEYNKRKMKLYRLHYILESRLGEYLRNPPLDLIEAVLEKEGLSIYEAIERGEDIREKIIKAIETIEGKEINFLKRDMSGKKLRYATQEEIKKYLPQYIQQRVKNNSYLQQVYVAIEDFETLDLDDEITIHIIVPKGTKYCGGTLNNIKLYFIEEFLDKGEGKRNTKDLVPKGSYDSKKPARTIVTNYVRKILYDSL